MFVVFFGNLLFYRFVLRKAYADLAIQREEIFVKVNPQWERYWSSIQNSADYVIHNERNKISEIIQTSKNTVDKVWSDYTAKQNWYRFYVTAFNNFLNLTSVLYFVMSNSQTLETGMTTLTVMMILGKISSDISELTNYYQYVDVLQKDYELFHKLVKDTTPRSQEKPISVTKSITIKHFSYVQPKTADRGQFEVKLMKPVTINFGQSILVKGTSGAGKSTFYNIISGIIPQGKISKLTMNVDGKPANFHNIEHAEAFLCKRQIFPVMIHVMILLQIVILRLIDRRAINLTLKLMTILFDLFYEWLN